MHKRIIPSTGEALPVIGMGTWQTFDIDQNESTRKLPEVLNVMKDAGGRMIDSSPMYGNAESTLGRLTADRTLQDHFFYATKVWTSGKQPGINQMESSFKKMKRTTMDLMQIHNLTDWKTQLQTLYEWKAAGKIRYTGITHYTSSMHEDLERIITSEKTDFVQFNYSLFSRNAEKSLLKAAQHHGVATIINLPFGQGSDLSRVKNKPLPEWSQEYSITSWAQFMLLYVISHPAVTVVIPATGNPEHAKENFTTGNLKMPDQTFRKKMADFADTL